MTGGGASEQRGQNKKALGSQGLPRAGGGWTAAAKKREPLAFTWVAATLMPPDGALSMDLLPRLGEAFRYEDIESHSVLFMGLPVPVATPATLWKMKHATVRAQDRMDASALNEKFDLGKE